MKLECDRQKLKDAVMVVEKAAGKNLSLPILSSVVLQAKEKTITIKATNLEIGIEMEIAANVKEAGSVAVQGALLVNFLSNLQSSDPIKLEVSSNNLKISTGRSATTLKSYSLDDFPLIPKVKDGQKIEVDSRELAEGIRSVIFAAATSDIKPEIASVYVYSGNQGLVFVSTDSFRLAEKTVKTKMRDVSPLIIPHRNAAELLRLLDSLSGEVIVNFNKNQLSLSGAGAHFTSRIIDGVFPDYLQIMPKESSTEVALSKAALDQALKISQIFTDRLNQISLTVRPAEKTVSLSSKGDQGENQIEVEAEISGEALELSLNARYLSDCLPIITDERVVLSLTAPNRPILVSGLGSTSFRYLVMPLNR